MKLNSDKLKGLGKNCLEFVFPSNIYCICCGNLIDNSRVYALCDSCLENLHWANGPTCAKCGKALLDTEGRQLRRKVSPETYVDLCHDCKENSHFFEKGFTCLQYTSSEKEMVHKFKFNGNAYMGEKLGKILLDRIKLEALDVDMVMAVPAHPKNQAKRGYNQSELMAKEVAKGLGLVYNNQVLARKTYKAPMNKLDVDQRKSNVRAAYGLKDETTKLNGERILLIDDIYTTGSTVDECSKVLLSIGADKVYILTLAAGVG